ncbi:alpha/beta fold hydrolase [Micromonospora sp. HM5-17]|uniref:alpha/beta fold hydrolase n=1 Tax=Micromonospora sp. HM5-17 TaxID=2487710 RepID=UPI000F475A3F|nr:alpha/beta fold hydrolase [Micromonospora sp. HM5-17]ROT31283.1 alpha/beta fold hydrolase [Micromonospora sp. HM5-17]
MATAPVNGIEIAYDDHGTGEQTLVLVHGHPFDRSMWQPQVAYAVRTGWRVIVADLRGYGESTVVPGRTTLDVFARDIAGLLDRLDVARFVLGGLSMGGQIVLECLRLFPDRVTGVLLAATSATAETESGRRWRNDLADRLLREGMAGYAEETLPKMLAPDNLAAMPEVARRVSVMMHTTSPVGAAAALRGRADRPDYVATLRQVAVPTLVVVGSEDAFTPLPDAELIAECVPGAELVVVDGAGHLPNLEREAAFNDALGRLLQRVAAAGVRR